MLYRSRSMEKTIRTKFNFSVAYHRGNNNHVTPTSLSIWSASWLIKLGLCIICKLNKSRKYVGKNCRLTADSL